MPTTETAATPPSLFAQALQAVSRRSRDLIEARIRDRGLTPARARALMLLRRHDRLIQAEFGERLGIESPSVVKLVDGLEKQGLIERRPVDGDRRAKQLALTAAGQAQALELDRIYGSLRDALLDGVSPADLEAALRVMRTIGENMGALAPGQAWPAAAE